MFDLWTVFFKTWRLHFPQCTLSDITGGTLSDYMQLSLEPQKAFDYFFSHTVCAVDPPQDL